jgi:AcrR family transcriptional regulator
MSTMKPGKSNRRVKRGEARDRLLEAAIDLFGRRGYDGVSTREIAGLAKVNLAGIAYNFGGKQGLYRDCIRHIAETVRAGLLAAGVADAAAQLPETPEAAKQMLHRMAGGFVSFFLGEPRLERIVRVVVREQMDPTPAFETIFKNVMEPMHQRICVLWAMATGQDYDSEAAKLATFSILGQVIVFRIAKAGILRRLGWRQYGPREIAAIEAMVHKALDAAIARARAEAVA